MTSCSGKVGRALALLQGLRRALDLDPAVLHSHVVADGVDGGRTTLDPPRDQVEARGVPRADHPARVDLPLGQGAARVAAGLADRQDRRATPGRGLGASGGDAPGLRSPDDGCGAGAVSRAVAALGGTGAGAVYGRCMLIDEKGRAIGLYRTEPFSYEALLRGNLIAQPSV